MTEETTRDCVGECRLPGNRGGYWPSMIGNYVIVHEKECDGKVRS